jgi:uncharacterized protein (DUF362 family)
MAMSRRTEKTMKRRDFFRTAMGAAAIAGSYGVLERTFRSTAWAAPESYDLVAIRGGDAETMFDKGIEAFGGIGAFVRKGHKVVVKPNVGWDVPPDRAGNTNPKLVARIVQHCLQAGAKEVYVFDHTCDNWQRCYRNSGIETAVKDAGGKMAPGNSESYYQAVTIPAGKTLKKTKEHELMLGADVVINVPVLKHHSSSRLTIGMKNLMGVVWDRGEWHGTDLHQCIADYATYRKPALNIVDASAVMKRNGPRGVSVEDVVQMKAMVLSRDIVAADAAATKLFGMDPADVRYIALAAEAGVGRNSLESLSIKRIAL